MLKFKHISLFFAAALMLLVMESCSKLDPIEPIDQDGVSLEKGKHIDGDESLDINALHGRGDDFGRPDDGGVSIEDVDNVNDDDDEENDDEEQTLSID